MDNLTIATFNIAGGLQTSETIKLIKQEITAVNPDIIGLQELDLNTNRHLSLLNMPELLKANQFKNVFFTPTIDLGAGQYGIGTLSNLNCLNKRSAHLESGGFEQRCYQRLVFEFHDQQLAFYNTHLSFENSDLRQQQLIYLKEELLHEPIPYQILTGDFNMDQSYHEFDILLPQYQLLNGNKGNWLATFPHPDDKMKTGAIDQIVVSSNISIQSVVIKLSKASDHAMLVGRIKFNGAV